MRLINTLNRRKSAVGILLVLVCITVGGWDSCPGKNEPKTVSEALTRLGNIKRELKAKGEISPQQDLDISKKLDAANRSYRQFVTDEQSRILLGTSDPEAKASALSQLRSLLNGLNDPSALGIKNPKSQQTWNLAVGTLNTILAGLGV